MRFTNIHNLPEPIVRALTYDDYNLGDADISVTSLLRPAQVAALEEMHADSITEDVSERVWQLWGSAAHEVLYRATDREAVIAERRLFMDVEGWVVSGKADIYDKSTKTITDYKTTSAWSVVFEPEGHKEWHEQLNLYRLLFAENGYEVDRLQLVLILRDWSEKDLQRSKRGYPALPIHIINVPVWEMPFARIFLENRVKAHQEAREGRYGPCSDEDRWMKDGVPVRCQRYCKVAPFCAQFNGGK